MSSTDSSLRTWLTLGRVSNLPTVWTNALAAVLLTANAGAATPVQPLLWGLLLPALSLLYLAGMLLNDVFDASWDRQQQNPRPIVLGLISKQRVSLVAWSMLLLALLLLLGGSQFSTEPVWRLCSVTLLVCFILAYNLLHKKYKHSVWLMGGCRFALYLTAAASLAEPPAVLWLSALLLGIYVSGLTYLAQHEHRNQLVNRWPVLLMLSPLLLSFYASVWWFWPFLLLWLGWLGWHYWQCLGNSEHLRVRSFIGIGLAALPLVDALVLALANQPLASLACVLVFVLLPRLQRWIRPT